MGVFVLGREENLGQFCTRSGGVSDIFVLALGDVSGTFVLGREESLHFCTRSGGVSDIFYSVGRRVSAFLYSVGRSLNWNLAPIESNPCPG